MSTDHSPLFVIGAGALTALALRPPRPARAARPPGAPLTWVWPVPGIVVDGQTLDPVITNGWGAPRRTLDGKRRTHRGADIMFRIAGRRRAFVPEGTPALAAAAGRVRWAGVEPRGHSVTIDHGRWTTFYAHLARLFVTRGDQVAAGQPIGEIGDDPKNADDPRHLHFELRRGGKAAGAVDPAPFLAAWSVVNLEPAPPLRNGALVYRPVGDRGEAYPDWVRDLRGESGVYVIRERGEVVYVGESHSGKLYETLTRHFQIWRRWKGWCRGQFGEGHDPGLTYARGRAEVAVRITSPADAIDEEARLIRHLRPRDNLLGQPVEAEAIPF